jgi:hypothetical protein
VFYDSAARRYAHSLDAGEVVAGTPEAFSAYVKSELARWTKVIAQTGAKAD